MTDMWELTPHSTQYYHSTATFAGNGMVTALQLVSPSLYTMNYTLDGEGRWNTLAQNSMSIVTGPAYPTPMYNAASQATEVDLTDGDKDLYTYSPYTGRMTQYEFEVGGANETGVLTWNANNTLQSLAITDGFNAGGSQTCASSYDDLARLAVFDCGSGNWGQDFGYDQYDNLTQTVISGRSGSTWNPGYSSSNNHVTGATYDASGDMTSDGGMNVYGWNWFNKLAWTAGSGTPSCGTNGKCITYDAFGRMVEKSTGAAWSEIWYTQVPGSQIYMSGATANYGYWPSPGRGTFIASGTNMFFHQDWLGNDRVVSAVSLHTVSADRAYAPYGEQYNTFGSTNPIYGMFAGITGDFDSGVLFDTPNRELAQYQGRWLSPDPAGVGWNQYGYPTNPNSYTFMGLEHGMDKLRKIQDSKGTHFSNSSGQVETFPSSLSIMVLIDQHCGYLSPDIAGDSNLLKDLDVKIEWYDGKDRRPVEAPTIDRRVSSLKEVLQTLTYRIHISAEEVPIVTHLLVVLSANDKQLAILDLHF